MKNILGKIKKISLLFGMCYFIYSSPYKNYFKVNCNSINTITKLFPKLIKTEINDTALALQINANTPVEDKYILNNIKLNDKKGFFLAVFDGHGGDIISEYAKEHLMKYFLSSYKIQPDCLKEEEKITKAIQLSFHQIEKELYKLSYERYVRGEGRLATVGSCALVGIVYDNKLYLANLGDSKARMFSVKEKNKTEKYTDYDITKVSTVYNARKKFEQERLIKEFPDEKNIYMCVSPKACYVKGRLQPTRSLGDFHLKFAEFNNHVQTKENAQIYKKEIVGFNGPYISGEPDIKIYELNTKDKYLLMASDGLWDFLKSSEIKDILRKNDNIVKNSYNILSKCIYKAASEKKMTMEQLVEVPEGKLRRKIHDDITLILVDLNKIKF